MSGIRPRIDSMSRLNPHLEKVDISDYQYFPLLALPFAEIWSAEDDGEAQLLQAVLVRAHEWLLLMAQKTHAIAKKYGSRISTNIS
jgi:mannose-6-phosphate isomerase class I